MARRNLTARDVLDMTSYHGARALLAAASLGVFEALAGRRATPAAVARRIACDPAATERLLAVLVGMRLLEREGRKVRLAPGARDLLTEAGDLSLSDLLRHRAARFRAWALLEDAVRTGRPVVLAGEGEDDPLALQAARARRDSARRWAPVVASLVDIGEAKSLLLLGDGPSIYALHFARARPRLQITVVDAPASIAVGREFLRGRPEARRIRLAAGDPSRDPLPGERYDAAFLSNSLHSMSMDAVGKLLRRVRKALRSKGLLVIRDRFMEEKGSFPVENALYDLQLLLSTREGRCHGLREVADAARAAGFRSVSTRDPGLADEERIVTGLA
jgi:SAM-dependent methyltransferase